MALLNTQTGEAQLDGTEVRVLFTVDAWLMIEAMTGKGILELIGAALELRLKIAEVQALILCGSEGYRRRHAPGAPALSQEQVNQLIEDHGTLGLIQQLAESIRHCKALGMNERTSEGAAAPGPLPGTGAGFSSAATPPGATPSP